MGTTKTKTKKISNWYPQNHQAGFYDLPDLFKSVKVWIRPAQFEPHGLI